MPNNVNPMAPLCARWLRDAAKKMQAHAKRVRRAYSSEGVVAWTWLVADAYDEAHAVLTRHAESLEKRLRDREEALRG